MGNQHHLRKGCINTPVRPLVFSTVACVKNRALVFLQFLLLWRNILPVFSLALKIYLALSKVTMIHGSVSVERAVWTVDDQDMSRILSSACAPGFEYRRMKI